MATLIDALLDEQSSLSAVEAFALDHDRGRATGPDYRRLLPATPPRPGQQYGFVVDLDKCSGCKACVAACHSLNGLDPGESWRDVGLLRGKASTLTVLQHVTTACHHCVEPACLDACPTLSYEKSPTTGIVRHLDDQCFGCQYCVWACPYDVPKYNQRLGIVRKCDMCADRLAVGEPPACVRSCPHEAIKIGLVDVDEARASTEFLPDAPPPSWTVPTTRFVGKRPLPAGAVSGDHGWARPEEAHWPLIAMLLLMQLATGAFLVHAALGAAFDYLPIVGALACLLGLASSLAHLGRPWLAHRAILGLRRSWLSREVAAFGAFAGAAALAGWTRSPEWSALAGALGLAGTFTSMMVYHVVRRPFWHFTRTGARFFGSVALLGLVAAWPMAPLPLAGPVAGVALAMMVAEALVLRRLRDKSLTVLRRSALLLTKVGATARPFGLRMALGMIGGTLVPLLIVAGGPSRADLSRELAAFGALTLVVAQVLERFVFFAAVVSPGMPKPEAVHE